jgi:hypothetical protein
MPTFQARTPSWWEEFNITGEDDADDYAVINQGQLKNLAWGAYQHLEDNTGALVPSGPSAGVETAISGWVDLVTGDPDPGPTADDFAVVNIGQLKALVKPFYTQLIEIGYASGYPWSSDTDSNYAAANIGQAKYLFSFDLNYDGNDNDIPDWIESVDPDDEGHRLNADGDGDDLSDQEELALGTSSDVENDINPGASTIELILLNPVESM